VEVRGPTYVLDKRALAEVAWRRLQDVMLKKEPPLSTGS
jgi:hypothetical protein